MGQTDVDLKNGMSIINLVNSRGYLPTCRILHMLLWMSSEVHDRQQLSRDYFVDVVSFASLSFPFSGLISSFVFLQGANIGSCTVHMAALGFPVISVEPVQQHVNTIQGSININPSFHIELQHIGMSSTLKNVKVNFGHGARNWGASEFHEVGANDTFELELQLKTLDQVLGPSKKVALMKVDCEGCEWETIKG
jgi:FkbM family methyltransferase